MVNKNFLNKTLKNLPLAKGRWRWFFYQNIIKDQFRAYFIKIHENVKIYPKIDFFKNFDHQ